MLNKSYTIFLTGLFSMITSSVMVYFDMRSFIVYALLAIGFVLIGIGILLGFIRMVTDNKQ